MKSVTQENVVFFMKEDYGFEIFTTIAREDDRQKILTDLHYRQPLLIRRQLYEWNDGEIEDITLRLPGSLTDRPIDLTKPISMWPYLTAIIEATKNHEGSKPCEIGMSSDRIRAVWKEAMLGRMISVVLSVPYFGALTQVTKDRYPHFWSQDTEHFISIEEAISSIIGARK